MAVYHSLVRKTLKNSGFVLAVVLFQLLFFSALCVYALESHTVHLRLVENYLDFYDSSVELENKIIQAKQPRTLIASLPCLSAQFYQITVGLAPVKLIKIIAVPYRGICKGKVIAIKYGLQAIYSATPVFTGKTIKISLPALLHNQYN